MPTTFALTPPLLTADLPGVGGKIKVFPEDFEVEEIPAYEPSGSGDFLYLWMEKRDMGAEYFARQIAKRLGSLTLIDFAVMDALIESLPTTAEAPSVHRPNLVNLAGGKGKSKTVLAAHKRRAAERAAKAEAAAKA